MKNKAMLSAVLEIILAVLTIYIFFTPQILTGGGFNLAVDGAVTGRTLCLLFGLFNIKQAVVHLFGSGE